MAGQVGDFGSGHIVREDGLNWGAHYWPIAAYKLHFTDSHEFRNIDPNCQEDMKACIYAWGGPKPSFISRCKLDFDRETGRMMILYLEKRFEHHPVSVPSDTSTTGDAEGDASDV